MILAEQLVIDLEQKLNKLGTSTYQGFPIEVMLLALNNAQLQLIKKKLGSNNIYGLGMDSFKKRYEDLQNLIIQMEELPSKKSKNIYQSYQADLTKTKEYFMLPILIAASCTKGSCKGRILDATKIAKHSDLQVMYGNTNQGPSFEYQESIATITNNQLEFYTDTTFSVDKIYFSYLRYPKQIDLPGYTKIDNTSSVLQNCEFVEYLKDELIDLAVLELALSTNNQPAIQASTIRLKNNE